MADETPVGAVSKSDCRWGVHACTCLFWSGGLGAGICAPGAVVSGLEQTCSGVYINKTVHDLVHHADFV